MLNQLTNISCIAGLITIFVVAAFYQTHFKWFAGVVAVLLILFFRNWLGEVSRKTEILMTLLAWCCILLTIIFLSK